MMCVVTPILPDREHQTQWPRPEGSVPVAEMEEVILPLPNKEGATVLALTKVTMGVVATNHMERVVRPEPLIKLASWWHTFPIQIAFTTDKDVHVKLGLKGTRSWTFGLL